MVPITLNRLSYSQLYIHILRTINAYSSSSISLKRVLVTRNKVTRNLKSQIFEGEFNIVCCDGDNECSLVYTSLAVIKILCEKKTC